jgi:hypothetical protein
MTCCETDITAQRNADCQVSYSFPVAYSLSGFGARLQVRATAGGATAYFTVTTTANANGSAFVIEGRYLLLTIRKEDLQLIPEADPVYDDAVAAYDIVLTDLSGIEHYFLGGAFIVPAGVTE